MIEELGDPEDDFQLAKISIRDWNSFALSRIADFKNFQLAKISIRDWNTEHFCFPRNPKSLSVS